MSTILEALKKSEQERKLNRLPTLSDMPAPQEPSKWPLVLGVVLCVIALLMLLITVFWWGKGSVNSAANSPESTLEKPSATVNAAPSSKPANAESESDDVIVNVISFSAELGQRFAMVNGKMVREGDFVQAGLQVEQINLDSVVLNHRGKQITLKP